MNYAKKTLPWIPVEHPDFKWTSGAVSDVQALWRKYGWTPPSEKLNPPAVAVEEAPAAEPIAFRRRKK